MDDLKKEEKDALTVQIERALLKKIKALAKKKGLTLRYVVEYGFKYILETHEGDL